MEKLIVFLFIIIFGIIRTLIEKSAEKKAAQARLEPRDPRLQARPDQKQRVQSELEEFLSDARTKQGHMGGGGRSAGPAPVAVGRVQPENSSSKSGRPSQSTKQKSKKRGGTSGGSTNPRQGKQAPARGKSEFVEATPVRSASGSSGSGIRDHVSQYMNQHGQPHMKSGGEPYFRSEKGDDESQSQGSDSRARKNAAAADLIGILRTPQGMRQAILVHEVLSRPRALRR